MARLSGRVNGRESRRILSTRPDLGESGKGLIGFDNKGEETV